MATARLLTAEHPIAVLARLSTIVQIEPVLVQLPSDVARHRSAGKQCLMKHPLPAELSSTSAPRVRSAAARASSSVGKRPENLKSTGWPPVPLTATTTKCSVAPKFSW